VRLTATFSSLLVAVQGQEMLTPMQETVVAALEES
jgi:hypothetical protein